MKYASKAALYLLTLAVLALFLPKLYDQIVFQRIEKTHLFYSPVSKRFIYTERAAAFDPAAAAKAEDHHSDIIYRDQEGEYYDRLEFERQLPFIYYRNMDLRGYLPMEIDGIILDRDTIKDERQVLELAGRNISGHGPVEDLWPLFEADPGQAGLVFPDDRCRFTETGLEFVNADYNRVDEELTARFSSALSEAGFAFPARHWAGTFTILKPFDNGVFLVDANGSLYHLKRLRNEPLLRPVALPEGLIPRHFTMSESERFHGLLLDTENRLHLVLRQDYGIVSIPIELYNPEDMDFKLLFDPLYRTAVYSDDVTIRALVMDTDYRPLKSFAYPMASGLRTWKHQLRDLLLPFSLTLHSPYSRFLEFNLAPGSHLPGLAMLPGLLMLGVFAWARGLRPNRPRFWAFAALFSLTGIYGLIAAWFIEE